MDEKISNDGSSKRKRGGSAKHVPPLKKRLVGITDDQAKLLRMWGRGDMSAGLRWLIDQCRYLVRKAEKKPDDHHNNK